MLKELSVKNFARIEDINVSFNDNMTVLTGETGAGKSLIIDTISLLLGARADSDMIRYNESKAVVKGVFSHNEFLNEIFTSNQIEIKDTITIYREITDDKRNIIKINDSNVTLNLLKQVSVYLADIHIQNDTYRLFNQDSYLDLVDPKIDNTFNKLVNDYQISAVGGAGGASPSLDGNSGSAPFSGVLSCGGGGSGSTSGGAIHPGRGGNGTSFSGGAGSGGGNSAQGSDTGGAGSAGVKGDGDSATGGAVNPKGANVSSRVNDNGTYGDGNGTGGLIVIIADTIIHSGSLAANGVTANNTTTSLSGRYSAMNGGSSGGGLFNEYGELLGIVACKVEATGAEGLCYSK